MGGEGGVGPARGCTRVAKPCVLLVEDDRTSRTLLRLFLGLRGMEVREAEDGRGALDRVQGCDAVLLDVGLPDLSGWQVADVLRDDHPDIPFVFVTALAGIDARLMGFGLGADDYIAKPYDMHELEARLRVVLRRRFACSQLSFQGTVIDLGTRCAFRNDERMPLSPLEFDVLALLASHPMRVWSRRELLVRAWGGVVDVTERTVDVRVRHLRAALDDDATQPRFIETVRGRGYRWIASPSP